MEDSEKFVCRFCNKRFQCGKSLGGHIRIHLNGSSTRATHIEEQAKFMLSKNATFDSDSETKVNDGQSGYGLRENPKKTRRFAFNTSNGDLVKICGECGKGFESMKAFCGHMACHSKISSFEDHSGTSEKIKEIDTESDIETYAQNKRRKSRRNRYKKIGVQSSSLSMASGLCSASDIEQEQEEVAVSLMMLSRDSGFKGSFSLVADSPDNNSVVFEAKSSSRIRTKNGINSRYNDADCSEKAKRREKVASAEKHHSPNFDSKHFSDKSKRLEYEISYNGFANSKEFKKQKVELGSGSDEEFDGEFVKRLSRFRLMKAKHGKYFTVDDAFDQDYIASMKQNTIKINSDGHKFFNKIANTLTDENSIDYKNTQTCSGKCSSMQNSSRNAEKRAKKKGKEHECPVCSKVFSSGQALGGHKRSHFLGGNGGGNDRTFVIKQEEPKLVDLNLPASTEE